MREVEPQSEGQYKLGPGTLYDNLQKLMDRGLVKETRKSSANEDPRRRYYRLTRVGRQILEADLERLKRVLKEATLRLSVREPAKLS
jgi:DNA-binding PadR family transcriptional regulator